MCLPNEAITIILLTFVQDGAYRHENVRLCCQKYRNFIFNWGLHSNVQNNEMLVNYQVEAKTVIRSRLKIFGENFVTKQGRLE
jgi:hypothetical protein